MIAQEKMNSESNNDNDDNTNDNLSVNVAHMSNGHNRQPSTVHTRLKSIESRQSVKIVLHNQSNRKVNITWIDYDGNERIYSKLNPRCKFVIDSYVTHPWIFRDIERKNLAIFDALVANRRDLLAFHKWDKYSEQKRFQVADRILFPRQHKQDFEFILVIIKNGVHSLQELCLYSLIEQLHRSSSSSLLSSRTSTTITTSNCESRSILPSYIIDNLPKHLYENLQNYLNNGQCLLEFLPLQ